ncbi:uncharacterized protein KZ484_025649 [Pholidichthys leucotaenia]
MGPRTLLLFVFVLLMVSDCSRGDQSEQSLTEQTSANAPAVGEPLTTAHPINIPGQHNRLRNGEGRKMVKKTRRRCLCQKSGSRMSRHAKPRKMCRDICKRGGKKSMRPVAPI